jgi:hypothetical protein
VHAVLREHQVEDGGAELPADPAHRDASAQDAAGAVESVEAGEHHLGGVAAQQRELG